MPCRRGSWMLGVALAASLGASAGARILAQTGQKPAFKSGVELIAVDVAIVDKNGNPIAGLRPDQFDVTIDNKPRRVVSAEFVEFAPRDTPTGARLAPAAAARAPFSSNQQPGPAVSQGRLIYLAIDQGSFRPFGARGAMEAARRFIDRLQPEDRLGLVAFPPPGPSVPASRDRAAALAATARIIGRAEPLKSTTLKNVSLSEALDIRADNAETLDRVVSRECKGETGPDRQRCVMEIRMNAADIALKAEWQATLSLSGIEAVIKGLAQIGERKTLVLVSAGLPVADRTGNDLQLTSTVTSLAREAAAANLNFFVLHVDSGFLDAFSADQRTISDTLSRDLGLMGNGLETIAAASGGSLARVVAGADFAFDRVLRETAAAYMLGVEPAEGDRDGKAHHIRVKVRIPNAEVRSRREFVLPKADAKPAAPDAAPAASTSSADTRALERVTRPVRIEREAGAAAGAPMPRVAFAAGESGSLVRAFARQDVLGRGTVEYFLGRLRRADPDASTDAPARSAAVSLVDAKFDEAISTLAPADPKSLSTAFLKGLALFGKGELEPAAAQFMVSLDAAPDFLPAAFYLGACYAAGGRDQEAVAVWQTALVSESDARIVYDVLGDALLRLQDGDEALNVLLEARDKWADDDGFVPRLAASEALRRNPQEAVALLDAHIARHPTDTNALLLALRLLDDARSAGDRIKSAAEDVASARRYADLYKAAGGPSAALVDRRVASIEKK